MTNPISKQKRLLLLAIVFCITLTAQTAALALPLQENQLISEVAPGNAYIPAGTIINCELITPLSSSQNTVGQAVMFRTIESLNLDNVPVVRYGTAGKAYVSIARKAGSFGVGGKIEMRPVSLKTIDGIEIPVLFGVDLAKYNQFKDIDTSTNAPLGLQKKGGGKNALATILSADGIASVWYGIRASNSNEAEIYNSYWRSYVAGGLFLLFSAAMLQGTDQQIPPFTRFQVTVVKDVDLGVPSNELKEKMSAYLSPGKNSKTARVNY